MHKSKAPSLPADQVITAPIDVFSAMSGIGREKARAMIRDGDLEAIKIGKRILIVIESYRRFVAAQRQSIRKIEAKKADSFFNGPPR